MRRGLNRFPNFRDQMRLRIQDTLQKFFDFTLFTIGLNFENLLKNAAFGKNFEGKVLKIKVKHPRASMVTRSSLSSVMESPSSAGKGYMKNGTSLPKPRLVKKRSLVITR